MSEAARRSKIQVQRGCGLVRTRSRMMAARRSVWPVAREIDIPKHGSDDVRAFTAVRERRSVRVSGLVHRRLATPGIAPAGRATEPAGHRPGAPGATSGMNRERLIARLR